MVFAANNLPRGATHGDINCHEADEVVVLVVEVKPVIATVGDNEVSFIIYNYPGRILELLGTSPGLSNSQYVNVAVNFVDAVEAQVHDVDGFLVVV